MIEFDAAFDSQHFLDCHNALNYAGRNARRLLYTGLRNRARIALAMSLDIPIAALEAPSSGDTQESGSAPLEMMGCTRTRKGSEPDSERQKGREK